jgi:hypothetical protein
MDPRRNSALSLAPTDASDADPATKQLTIQQQAWIDYNALNGLITDILEEKVDPKTGTALTMRKMTIQEFAELIDVHRDTLRVWRTAIPNFWERVNQRRKELAPTARLQQIHERWYLNALKMKNWPVTEAWLRNFDPDYREPKQKIEHELGNSWMALFEHKRKVIEGEVVDDPSAN